MGEVVILMGPNGAGKSIQGEFMSSYGWTHISSGELLRHDPAESDVLSRGELAPSGDVERLVDAAVNAVATSAPVVLDGFPRTIDEAEWLDQQIGAWQRQIRAVIFLDVSEKTSVERLKARRRSDDSGEAQRNKWAEYERETRPLVEYYQKAGLLHLLDGDESVDEVGVRIKELLSR